MFYISREYTNYALEFEDPETFKLILDNDESDPTCKGYRNSLYSVLNRMKGVAQVYWENYDTEDLFSGGMYYMYIDILNGFCHEEILDTVEEHTSRFIEFWEGNKNA